MKLTGPYTAKAYSKHPGRNPKHSPGHGGGLEIVGREKVTHRRSADPVMVTRVQYVDRSRWLAHRGAKERGVSR